jgi:hypothetical protein
MPELEPVTREFINDAASGRLRESAMLPMAIALVADAIYKMAEEIKKINPCSNNHS